jgi:hypothetical protein
MQRCRPVSGRQPPGSILLTFDDGPARSEAKVFRAVAGRLYVLAVVGREAMKDRIQIHASGKREAARCEHQGSSPHRLLP